jgi:GNAT superfamily N-acetyltransferase
VVPFERRREKFCISTDPDRLDIQAMHAYLSRSYWAEGIPLEVVTKSVEGSLCFGLFEGSRQIGLARVITDRATFAYLCDVYVLEEYRGQGLGKWLMEAVRSHPDLQNLRRFVLLTRDAHGLYEQFGFTRLGDPSRYMEIADPEVYQRGFSKTQGG